LAFCMLSFMLDIMTWSSANNSVNSCFNNTLINTELLTMHAGNCPFV
jgi:hypothetical protein